MAVAATFLAVSATSALAQGDAPRNNAAELAIDAAIPLPEPANVPPPTASDFKLDTTATVSPGPAKTPDKTPDLAKTPEQAKAPEPTKPLDAVAAPAAEPAKTMASPPAATATAPEPAKD
ncbi:MAG: murein L,D-transpeptidase, partial [Bradyrhizobium sp.]|nr:murein L,D-transpeptidase [Bradyrhizobium sp.]